MLTVIYTILIALDFLLVLLKKKPKVMLFVNIIFVLVLIYGNTKTNDYNAYEAVYETGQGMDVEIGYRIMMNICNYFGMTFDQFRLALVIVFGGIVLWVFSRYSNNYPFFFCAYYIYLIFIDITQIRTFCVTALLVLAIHFLFSGKRALYILTMIVGITFHIEIGFFAPLLFWDFSKRLSKNTIRRLAMIVLIICGIVFIMGNNWDWLADIGYAILHTIGMDYKTGYFVTTTRYGFLVYFLPHIAGIVATYFSYSICKNRPNSDKVFEFCDKCLTLQMFCVLCFPLIMININFFRLYRIASFVNYISWAIMLDSMERTKNYYKIIFAIFVSLLIYRMPLVQGNGQRVMILDNNRFFNRI